MMSPDDIRAEIQTVAPDVIRLMIEEYLAQKRNEADREVHAIKRAFETHYTLYGATTMNYTPPRGAIVMIDAGMTPNRAIALYLSAGDKMVEVFAKVI